MTSIEFAIVVAVAAKLGAELLLEYLNRRHVAARSGAVPEAFAGSVSPEAYIKSVQYTLAKSRFGTIELLWSAAILVAALVSGALPAAFEAWTAWLGQASWSEALFLIAVVTALGLPSLPLEYWEQFKLEERFGFNKSSVGLWVVDKIKGMLLGIAIGFPLLWLLISLVGWLGSWWWLYGFAILFCFQLIMMVLYPMLILPLFNKLSPLADGSLKTRLMAMSEKAGFHCNSIQVIDGSKRSAHSNAYFTGFGRFRRIVLYDTLIEQLSEEEIEAVLAHEIGHYKRGHIPKIIGLSALMMLGGFWSVHWLASSAWFFRGFGFESASLGVAFLLFALIGGLFTFWLTPLFNLLSRKHEYEADAFARDVVGDWRPLSGALRRLSEKNLSNLTPHPAYSGFHYSHPTLLEREAAMRA